MKKPEYVIHLLIGGYSSFATIGDKLPQYAVSLQLTDEQNKIINDVRDKAGLDFGCKMILSAGVIQE